LSGGTSVSNSIPDSILKYKSSRSVIEEPAEQRSKFLYDYQAALMEQLGVGPNRVIECQIMDLADDIGNALIDFTDGVRSSIISSESVTKWRADYGEGSDEFAVKNVKSAFEAGVMERFASVSVGDCVKNLHIHGDLFRNSLSVSLREPYQSFIRTLKKINSSLLFQDPEIRSNDNAGAFKIRTLFEVFVRHYCDKPNNRLVDSGSVPADWHARIEQSSTDAERLRHITDYLAGMTDDYADMMFEKAIHSAL
jgi:dGTP triphosphohydrolase